MDKISPEERSRNMQKIRSKDTTPEMVVRRQVHKMGYRYRLHGKLPGRPDMIFVRKRKVIFVHGCFWHQHDDASCRIVRVPKSKTDYWLPKLERNHNRDIQKQEKLRELGWDFLVIWECQLRGEDRLAQKIRNFLDSSPSSRSERRATGSGLNI